MPEDEDTLRPLECPLELLPELEDHRLRVVCLIGIGQHHERDAESWVVVVVVRGVDGSVSAAVPADSAMKMQNRNESWMAIEKPIYPERHLREVAQLGCDPPIREATEPFDGVLADQIVVGCREYK